MVGVFCNWSHRIHSSGAKRGGVGAGFAFSYLAQGPSLWGSTAHIHSEWVYPLQLT